MFVTPALDYRCESLYSITGPAPLLKRGKQDTAFIITIPLNIQQKNHLARITMRQAYKTIFALCREVASQSLQIQTKKNFSAAKFEMIVRGTCRNLCICGKV